METNNILKTLAKVYIRESTFSEFLECLVRNGPSINIYYIVAKLAILAQVFLEKLNALEFPYGVKGVSTQFK